MAKKKNEEKSEEQKNLPFIERWVARDEDGALYLYFGEKPEKCNTIWDDYEDSFIAIDDSLFPEVQWSDEEPTKVKLVIDK